MQPVRDPEVLEGYLTDASNITGHAEGLVRANSTAEVAEVVRYCQAEGIPLTVTAQRTSTTAAPVPFGGWLLSLERMNAILSVDATTATAQAGVILGDLQRACLEQGRLYPPDPTSWDECSLGGSIACNASGARTFKYGATRQWVEAIEVVLPDGTILQVKRGDPIPADWPIPKWTEPLVKTAAGYPPPSDLLDLFIGQEGTLGVITQATVRTTPAPAGVIGFLLFFPSRETAVTFVEGARAAARADRSGPLSPRCLEYLDHHCLSLARERVGDVPDEARAALFCEQEIEACGEEAHLEAWWALLETSGALADDTLVASTPGEQARLHALRHAVPAGVNEQVIANGMPKVGTDLSVPNSALSEIMSLYEAAPLDNVLFGHIGDNHLHLNLLPKNDAQLAEAKAFYRELAARAVALGGSVSAEHGIGKIKKDYLAMMVSEETLAQFRALKRHVDPGWILGRGTLFEA